MVIEITSFKKKKKGFISNDQSFHKFWNNNKNKFIWATSKFLTKHTKFLSFHVRNLVYCFIIVIFA